VKTWDVVVVGGGIIGLTLALDLRRHGVSVMVVERGEAGREASYAAAGMLAYCDPGTPPSLQALCFASAGIYPEFVHILEDESGYHVDFRRQGTIAFVLRNEQSPCSPAPELTPEQVRHMEPHLEFVGQRAVFLPEQTVDNRELVVAALKACKHRGVDLASGSEVTEIHVQHGRAAAVATTRTRYGAAAVVNCAGAWAGQVGPIKLPTRPVKGQMLAVAASHRKLLEHVVRAPDVYLVPRSDGRILIGATVEEAGYDKRLDADVMQRFHRAAANLLPAIADAHILEAWAGLRPGTIDDLPILGATSLPGYFVATGHFRNGILLSAITATVMSEVVRGQPPSFDISPFSAARFE
jgi:glycine oxidase